MNTPQLLALGTQVPAARYSQQAVAEHITALQDLSDRRARAIHAIYDRAGVGFRHFVVPRDYFAEPRSTQARNDLYMQEAVPLGEAAIQAALRDTDYTVHDIDDFIVVSCTGISTPGLDLHLAGRMGMRPDLRRTCVLGMGCYGAFPAVNRASEAVRAHPERRALVLCVELCSLHIQMDQTSEDVVSSALFADGAAAVLLGGAGHSACLPRVIGAATACDYTTLEHMSFSLTDHGFRMYLSSYVPDLLSSQVKGFVEGFLADHGLSRQEVRLWGIHPGSSKVVDYVQAQLGLSDTQVEPSHDVLHHYGNMSSTTILFVLENIIRCQQPQSGDYGVLLAFGPGLTMEALLVQW
ncbi:MAG: type III polyketide synthase [Anaerolineae bacterium]